jgi:uncharacterized hydrophobic protein (TIGR00271 family)
VLRVRLAVGVARVDGVVAALLEIDGVGQLLRLPLEGAPDTWLLIADVSPAGADRVTSLVRTLGPAVEDFVLVHENVVATPSLRRSVSHRGGFGWVEILGAARTNSRPFGGYLALIAAAAVIAALGVITSNGILIVGAMAVSPDLLPVCATCVGIVNRRPRLALRAFLTLLLGLVLVGCVAAGLTALLHATGLIGDVRIGSGGLSGLARTDYSTVLVALAAGVAAIISFETRASTVVGVAISVTTIPASAYFGVALGLGELDKAWGALLVLTVNVALLIVSGSATLALQSALARRAEARAS